MKARYSDLAGENVVITGAANGIGESMARAFDGQGSTIHFGDIDAAKGKEVSEELFNANFSRVDLREPGFGDEDPMEAIAKKKQS